MPKVSFRMVPAPGESVLGVQTSTERKIIGQATPRAGSPPRQADVRTKGNRQWDVWPCRKRINYRDRWCNPAVADPIGVCQARLKITDDRTEGARREESGPEGAG